MLDRLFGTSGKDKAKTPPNRDITFEVMAMGAEGRWLIDQVFSEEEAAIAHADALLNDTAIKRVQVVRERSSKLGPRLVATVYEREQTGKQRASAITLAAAAEGDAWCSDLPDLFGDESRRMIGRVLRNFLDRHQATPSELLFDYRLYRKLDNAGSLASSAVQRVAEIQATQRGLPIPARTRELEKMVAAAVRLAREHGAERTRPRLGEGGLPGLRRAALRFRSDPFQQSYAVQAAVAEALRQIPAITGKLERVLELVPRDEATPADLALLDGLLADCLGAAQTAQDLLGRQPDLLSALQHLGALATRRHEGKLPGAPAFFDTVADLIQNHDMPATRAVLLDRMLRELAGERPLSRAEPMQQRKQLKGLAALLTTPEGALLGGSSAADALGRRSRALNLRNGYLDLPPDAGDPKARLEQVLEADARNRADDAKLCLATYALDAVRQMLRDPAACAALAPRVAASDLPEPARSQIVASLESARQSSQGASVTPAQV